MPALAAALRPSARTRWERSVHGGAEATQDHGRQEIGPAEGVYLRMNASQQVNHRIQKKKNRQGVEKRNPGTARNRKPGGGRCPLRLLSPETAGHFAGSPYAEEIGDGGEPQEGRHADRDGRQVCVAPGEADKKGVRQIVEYQNHLAEDRRKGQAENSLGNRSLLKQLGFPRQLFHVGSSFLFGQTPGPSGRVPADFR